MPPWVERQEALSECRRAVELLPVEKDAFNGPLMIQWFAISAAWVGEKDLACEQLPPPFASDSLAKDKESLCLPCAISALLSRSPRNPKYRHLVRSA